VQQTFEMEPVAGRRPLFECHFSQRLLFRVLGPLSFTLLQLNKYVQHFTSNNLKSVLNITIKKETQAKK